MEFMFFFFEPLQLEKSVNQIEQFSYDQNEIRNSYWLWLIDFCRKSILFYQNQHRAHKEFAWSEFCLRFGIPDYENPSNLGLEIEWEEWKEGCFLNGHYKDYQKNVQTISDLQEIANREMKSSEALPIDTIPMREFDKVWFNNLINNPPQTIAELRNLKYEKYLQTPHWKKIRAAIFLINKAVCQADDCNVVGESWYGGSESGLDVHHLSYENRGNERFEDLTLLCKQHHELSHNTRIETSPDGEESNNSFSEDIFDDDMEK
jgi:5-methylcytosine-specific restriction endonuclease McrA